MNPNIPGVLPALNSIAQAPKIKPVLNPFEEKDQFRSRSARARAALFLTVVINLSHRKFRYVYGNTLWSA